MPAPKLESQRRTVARGLAEGKSKGKAGDDAGVNRRSVTRWCADPSFVQMVVEEKRKIERNDQRRSDRALGPDRPRVDDPIRPDEMDAARAELRGADPFRDPRTVPGHPPVLDPERREISDAEAQRRWILDNQLRFGRISEDQWRYELAHPPTGRDRPRTPQVRVIPVNPMEGSWGRGSLPTDPFEGMYYRP